MPVDRFFINEKLEENREVFLHEEEAHHLIHVMRGKEGESVEIVNGKNQLGSGIIKEIRKKDVVITLKAVISRSSPKKEMILAQAIPQKNRLDTILEKGCELGMTSIWLFPGERSERSDFSENQNERMRRILISALKQCGRLDLPTIVLKPFLKEWKKEDFIQPAFFGDPEGSFETESPSLFFIGPEGGFTKTELEIFKKFQVRGRKLHENVLRTDTAAIVAVSVMNR